MNKLLLLCATLLLASLSVSAQTDSRRGLDNFDIPGGVRVEEPQPAATKPSKLSRKRLRLTSRSVGRAARDRPADFSGSLYRMTVEEAKPAPAPAPPVVVVSAAVSKSLDGFSTGDPQVDSFIVESGTRNGIDPVLLYAIMHRESSFKKRALSYKGASGLMQLMPATARRFGVRNIWDPRQNVEGGARYMRVLLDLFGGDVRLALAGYNAGEGAVMKYGYRVPPYRETQEYVRRISERYALMRDPQTARRAPVASRSQLARIKSGEQQAPLYEQQVFAVRMPDGKLRLVSQ